MLTLLDRSLFLYLCFLIQEAEDFGLTVQIGHHGGHPELHLNVPTIQVRDGSLCDSICIILLYTERGDTKMGAQHMREVLQAFLISCEGHYKMYYSLTWYFCLPTYLPSFRTGLSEGEIPTSDAVEGGIHESSVREESPELFTSPLPSPHPGTPRKHPSVRELHLPATSKEQTFSPQTQKAVEEVSETCSLPETPDEGHSPPKNDQYETPHSLHRVPGYTPLPKEHQPIRWYQV